MVVLLCKFCNSQVKLSFWLSIFHNPSDHSVLFSRHFKCCSSFSFQSRSEEQHQKRCSGRSFQLQNRLSSAAAVLLSSRMHNKAQSCPIGATDIHYRSRMHNREQNSQMVQESFKLALGCRIQCIIVQLVRQPFIKIQEAKHRPEHHKWCTSRPFLLQDTQ